MPNYTVQYPSQESLVRDLNADRDGQEYKHVQFPAHFIFQHPGILLTKPQTENTCVYFYTGKKNRNDASFMIIVTGFFK